MKSTFSTNTKSPCRRRMAEPLNGGSGPSAGCPSLAAAKTGLINGDDQLVGRQQQAVKERSERHMRRWTAALDDLRTKLEREKAEALDRQKEAMNRAFRVQLSKLLKEKEELQRKCHQMQQCGNKDASSGKAVGQSVAACPAEVQRLAQENALLKSEKKRQEEQLQAMKESEQHRFEDMRSLLDDKARQLTLLQKQLRQQVTRLREESTAKDRVISHLEAELRVQSGRAQQFRDILEHNLLAGRCSVGQQNDEIVRHRKLQLKVDELQETMRQQQETFAQEKRELLRRLSETEEEQRPLRQKSKQYLTRNVQLSVKNHELTESLRNMQQLHNQQQHQLAGTSRDDINLTRSLSRPNVNHIPPQSKAQSDKQRRIEYVQQIQKMRKEQRYYSMWELPPLLEVETDGHGDAAGSDGSLSPAATSGVTSCSSSDSTWNEDTRRELEVLFSQLSREHSELQRNYQMLHDKLKQLTCFSEADANNVNYATLQADYAAARARIRDLEEIVQLKKNREVDGQQLQGVPSLLEIQARFLREKHHLQTQVAILNQRLLEASKKQQAVQAELNEARDQNELLEFRILELEECQEAAFSQCSSEQPDRKDVCTDTDSDDLVGDSASVGDSGIVSLTSLVVDCPSPTMHGSSSSSSGSSPGSDYLGEKISMVKAELQHMVSTLSDPSQKAVLVQLQALLGARMAVSNKNSDVRYPSASSWDWQLHESGVFEEDQQQQVIHHADSTTQTEEGVLQHGDVSVRVTIPLPLNSQTEENSKSVQAVATVQDVAVQASARLDLAEVADLGVQTADPVMTLADFRDIESYYLQQIELLQKEKSSQRKKFQASREEAMQLGQQLELLGQQFQEREKQFEEILQKNCRAFERELDSARNLNASELSTLKECLQLVWHELKDYAADLPATPKTSAVEFTRALINSLQGVCSELVQLRQKVADLAEMEQAFKTTLQQADGLVHHIEEKHLRRIRELEMNEQELRQELEAGGHHQQIRQRRLSDDEGCLIEIKIQELKQENEALSAQVGKCQELEDYCQQLNSRLEEYEQREKGFQHVLQEAERRFAAREQRYKEEVELMRSELEKCRENELCWRRKLEHRESQLGEMKVELEVEQKTISTLEAEVKDLQSKLEKEDTSFRNEVTKLRSQLNISLAQLTELESLNCQLREQIVEHQNLIASLQRSLDKESSQNQDLAAENKRLLNQQAELAAISDGTHSVSVLVGKPLTEELFEVESDGCCEEVQSRPAVLEPATLDDFREISLPNTPDVMDGCSSNVFEEHFKVLESLESYLEAQQNTTGGIAAVLVEDTDESGISTSPSIHESESMALLEAQLSQLRSEKHFLLNSVVHNQKKDEIIQILVDQLKYNAPRQYLIETAAHIRRIVDEEDGDEAWKAPRDDDIEAVCRLLEAPIDLPVTADSSSRPMTQQQRCLTQSHHPSPSSTNSKCNQQQSSDSTVVLMPSSPHKAVRQTTVTVLPEEDPLLCPASDLRVTRKVGQDGLVIAWLPSPDPECTGYLICVNGHEAQRIRNAQRTKAVLCGLDLNIEMEIRIYALSGEGLVSRPDGTLYRPGEQLPPADSDQQQQHQQPQLDVSPREVVVQTFYTNSSVTIRSSRRVAAAPATVGSRIPVPAVRSSVP